MMNFFALALIKVTVGGKSFLVMSKSQRSCFGLKQAQESSRLLGTRIFQTRLASFGDAKICSFR